MACLDIEAAADKEILYPSLDSQDSFPAEDVKDGPRLVIDMILVYTYDGDEEMSQSRKYFQDSLLAQGLKLQEEKGKDFDESHKMFVKVHAPINVLSRQADVLCLKKSVKQLVNLKAQKKSNLLPGFLKARERNEPSCLKAAFREDISEVFVSEGEELKDIFTAAERSEIVWDILLKTKYGSLDKQIGIRRLLNASAYIAAYPLHEGPHLKVTNSRCVSDRQKLYQEWAYPSRWYKTQPLDLIRKYFGDEVGIYFAWLGFYTKMLIPASIVGFMCFIYGLASVGTNFNIPSQEICDTTDGKPGSYLLCPSCLDGACPYEKLGDSCVYSQLSYLFDNPATVAFAIFMSFWATMFLELWKRRQARLISHWGLSEAEFDMETRPEFDAQVSTTRINKLTGKEEPYLTLWSRTLRFTATISGIAFMISVVIIAFVAIIVYKIAVAAALYTGTDDEFLKENSQILTTVTAAIINLVIILVLGIVYRKFAKFLTDLECPRTQTEYDNSFTFKIFVFEFVNCYSLLFYIAFFKGKFYTYPGDDKMWKTFFGIGADQCDPAGCISELFIQLMIIMVGKQIFNNLSEIVIPMIMKRFQKTQFADVRQDEPWERDFHLQTVADNQSMFSEILEMVLQYGFLTLFVAAFPLAPIFALLNNLVEIRVDAFKFTVQQKRPIPKRIASLGAWFNILQSLTFLAVVSNAFVIAYTSEFIPRIVYMMTKSPDGSLTGYVDFTLSVFNSSDYSSLGGDGLVCRYRGYRTPPTDSEPYTLTSDYWNVVAARLAFVVVFEHIVLGITGLLAYLIPDLPRDVKEKAYVEEKLLAERTQQFRLQKLHSKIPEPDRVQTF